VNRRVGVEPTSRGRRGGGRLWTTARRGVGEADTPVGGPVDGAPGAVDGLWATRRTRRDGAAQGVVSVVDGSLDDVCTG